MRLFILCMFTLFSCSHHHKESAHHHDEKTSCDSCPNKDENVAFKKMCAHSVLEGDTHVEGKEEFSLSHGGKKYYFSTKEKMESFQANLNENVEKANTNWERFSGR